MIRLEMKKYNMILIEKQLKYNLNHQVNSTTNNRATTNNRTDYNNSQNI